MATPLTDATADRIAMMFPLADHDLVCALLIEECGANLPLLKAANRDRSSFQQPAIFRLRSRLSS
jgi:hypothetical protein